MQDRQSFRTKAISYKDYFVHKNISYKNTVRSHFVQGLCERNGT